VNTGEIQQAWLYVHETTLGVRPKYSSRSRRSSGGNQPQLKCSIAGDLGQSRTGEHYSTVWAEEHAAARGVLVAELDYARIGAA
jgi:hypothetical protein